MHRAVEKLLSGVTGSFLQFGVRDAFDIIIIAFVIYQLIVLTKETRAIQVLKGLSVLFISAALSEIFNLQTVSWLLSQMITAGTLVIVILFQPELRRALEQIGRGKLFNNAGLLSRVTSDADYIIDSITTALVNLAARQVGALVIIQRKTRLGEIISTGTRVEGMVSAALIEQIFEPNTPLHDGALIIKNGIIVSAGCFLPLSDNMTISRQLGTRHRAALGVSEVSDCFAFIVSEETGVIAIAREGKLVRYLDEESIREILAEEYSSEDKHKNILDTLISRLKRDKPNG